MSLNHPALRVEGLSHSFNGKKVLTNINFEIKAGQVVALVGPSGCGKSTLLRAILGTHPPKEGKIWADDKLVTEPNRNVGIVYQDYALFPFLTARKNVMFGPKVDQTALPYRFFRPLAWKKVRKGHWEEAGLYLDKVGLADCGDNYPTELSGGQRQRVAIAQSLIMKPSILLMDEPFGALDEATRESLQLMLITLYQENVNAKKEGKRPPHTILIVTHELNEALYVSDRIIGLSQYHSLDHEGSTIVYDQPCPVFRPTDSKDFSRFAKQKDDVRRVVFSPEHQKASDKLIAHWTDSPTDCLPGDPNYSPDRI